MKTAKSLAFALACAGGVFAAADTASADAIADFYKENRFNLVIGYSPGGGFDRGGRIVAKHIVQYIPGQPTIVTQNMPGGGSMRALNWLYVKAPKDGTAMAHFHPAAVREDLMGGTGVEFDARKFYWIGSYNRDRAVTFVRSDSGIKTIQDAMKKEVVLGATSPRSGGGVYPRVVNAILGTKFKVIVGYGSTGESTLAMERGEVQGIGSWTWSQLKVRQADWVKNKFVNVLLQLSVSKHRDLPDVPTPLDLATSDEQRKLLHMIFVWQDMGRPLAMPPGTDLVRGKVIRAAFDKLMTDKAFEKDIIKGGLEVDPMGAAEVDDLLAKLYALPKATLDRGRTVYADMRSSKLSEATKKKLSGAKLVKVATKGSRTKIELQDNSGKSWKFNATRRTKVKVGGGKAKPTALKAGMTCDVTFFGNGGLAYNANCK